MQHSMHHQDLVWSTQDRHPYLAPFWYLMSRYPASLETRILQQQKLLQNLWGQWGQSCNNYQPPDNSNLFVPDCHLCCWQVVMVTTTISAPTLHLKCILLGTKEKSVIYFLFFFFWYFLPIWLKKDFFKLIFLIILQHVHLSVKRQPHLEDKK